MVWVLVILAIAVASTPLTVILPLVHSRRGKRLLAVAPVPRQVLGDVRVALGGGAVEEVPDGGRMPLTAEGVDVTFGLHLRKDANQHFIGKGKGPLIATGRLTVDARGLEVPFRLRPRRTLGLASVQKALGLLDDTELGDAAFDDSWIVESELGLARAALPARVRERLRQLVAGLPGLARIELGPDGLSIEWQALAIGKNSFMGLSGLEPRWGTTEPAKDIAFVKDTLLEIRSLLLRHVEREGLARVKQGVFREVRVEVEVEVEQTR